MKWKWKCFSRRGFTGQRARASATKPWDLFLPISYRDSHASPHAAGPAGALAPALGGAAPRGTTIIAKRVVVGAVRRLGIFGGKKVGIAGPSGGAGEKLFVFVCVCVLTFKLTIKQLQLRILYSHT